MRKPRCMKRRTWALIALSASGAVSKVSCEPVVQPYCGPPVCHKKAATALYCWLSKWQPHTSGRELWGMEELCPPTSGSETRVFVNWVECYWLSHSSLLLGSRMSALLQINRRKTVDPITFILELMFWKLLWSFKNKHFFFPSSSSKF